MPAGWAIKQFAAIMEIFPIRCQSPHSNQRDVLLTLERRVLLVEVYWNRMFGIQISDIPSAMVNISGRTLRILLVGDWLRCELLFSVALRFSMAWSYLIFYFLENIQLE